MYISLEDRYVAHNFSKEINVNFGDIPDLLVYIFPYLYINGKGYHSFVDSLGDVKRNEKA